MKVPAGVAAGHPWTARTGADLLRRGGSAADAAVAMMLVSCAAETIFTGLGGGGFATYYDAEHRAVSCVDFFVAVPGLGGRPSGSGLPIEVFFVGQQVPYDIGPATVAVPGVPAGAWDLWQRWGRLDWSEVVAPASQAALGAPLPQAHADLLPSIAPAMLVGEGSRVYTRPDGQLLQAGDLQVHRDLVRAFDLLAKDPDAFYSGDYASALLDAIGADGALDTEDLAAYRVVESSPVSAEFWDHSVWLRGDDLDHLLGTLVAASDLFSGEPVHEPTAALALVDALRATERRGDTTNLVAVDRAGNACVITTTLGLGAGVWVPGYGVHLNSMLGEGELIRERLAPGARMGSMMSPLVVLDADRRLVLGAGAAGGSRIRSALLQVVLRVLRGASPQEAIDAPRLAASSSLVRCEPGFDREVLEALQAAGNNVQVAEHRAAYFGGVTAVGRRGAGADPRRGGAVVLLDRVP